MSGIRQRLADFRRNCVKLRAEMPPSFFGHGGRRRVIACESERLNQMVHDLRRDLEMFRHCFVEPAKSVA